MPAMPVRAPGSTISGPTVATSALSAAPRRSIAGTVFHAPCSMLLQRCHRVVATWAPGRVAGDARRRQRRFD